MTQTPMSVRDQVEAALQKALSPSFLEVLDESAAHMGHAGSNGTPFGTHFKIRINCGAFQGKARVAQHQLVYEALGDLMVSNIHALVIKVVVS